MVHFLPVTLAQGPCPVSLQLYRMIATNECLNEMRTNGWVLPPLSNSWIIFIIWLYIALNRTPNVDCYWGGGGGAVPKPKLMAIMAARSAEIERNFIPAFMRADPGHSEWVVSEN